MSRYRDDRDDYYGGTAGRERPRREEYDWREAAQREDYRRRDPRGGEFEEQEFSRRGVGRGGNDWRETDDYGRAGSNYGYGGAVRTDYADRSPQRGYERDTGGGGGYDEDRYYGRPAEGRGASRSHVRCRDIMTRDLTVATRTSTLRDVAAMMRDEDTGVIPVVEHEQEMVTDPTGEGARRTPHSGKLVGLITDRDIAVRAIADGRNPMDTRAEEVMTDDIYSAHPNDRVIDVIRQMGDKQVRRIPIVDKNGNLVGIISMADVALETEADRELAEALEEISSGSSFWSKIFG